MKEEAALKAEEAMTIEMEEALGVVEGTKDDVSKTEGGWKTMPVLKGEIEATQEDVVAMKEEADMKEGLLVSTKVEHKVQIATQTML
jgi:hypothetical protein